MRKYAFLLAIILLLGTATACAANTTAPANSDTPTATEETTSAVVSDSPTSTVESEPTAAASEPTKTTSQAATSAVSSQTPNSTSKPTDPLKTNTPVESSKPAASTAPTTPSITEPSVTSTPPPTPDFDVNTWVKFATDYGEQIGLIYDDGTTGSWDNPIAAGATLKYTERDIKNRLDRYKQDGIQYFSVWAEARTDGSGKYDIYIGYA